MNLNRLVSSNQSTKESANAEEQGLGEGLGQGPRKGLGQGFEPGPGPGPGRWDHRGVPGPAEICHSEVFLGSPYLGNFFIH